MFFPLHLPALPSLPPLLPVSPFSSPSVHFTWPYTCPFTPTLSRLLPALALCFALLFPFDLPLSPFSCSFTYTFSLPFPFSALYSALSLPFHPNTLPFPPCPYPLLCSSHSLAYTLSPFFSPFNYHCSFLVLFNALYSALPLSFHSHTFPVSSLSLSFALFFYFPFIYPFSLLFPLYLPFLPSRPLQWTLLCPPLALSPTHSPVSSLPLSSALLFSFSCIYPFSLLVPFSAFYSALSVSFHPHTLPSPPCTCPLLCSSFHLPFLPSPQLSDHLKVAQSELQTQVQELDRAKKIYYDEEHVAHDAREKASAAEEK